jgi:hypothetical protein
VVANPVRPAAGARVEAQLVVSRLPRRSHRTVRTRRSRRRRTQAWPHRPNQRPGADRPQGFGRNQTRSARASSGVDRRPGEQPAARAPCGANARGGGRKTIAVAPCSDWASERAEAPMAPASRPGLCFAGTTENGAEVEPLPRPCQGGWRYHGNRPGGRSPHRPSCGGAAPISRWRRSGRQAS